MPFERQVQGGYLLKDGTFRRFFRRKGERYYPFTCWAEFLGQNIKCYSIGWLAQMSEISQDTIRRWMFKKEMPRPIMDLGDGNRWFTAGELNGYTKLIRLHPPLIGQAAVLKRRELGMTLSKFRYHLMLKFKKKLLEAYQDEPEKIQKEIVWLNRAYHKKQVARKRERKWRFESERILNVVLHPPKLETVSTKKKVKKPTRPLLVPVVARPYVAEPFELKVRKSAKTIAKQARAARLKNRDQKQRNKKAAADPFADYTWDDSNREQGHF